MIRKEHPHRNRYPPPPSPRTIKRSLQILLLGLFLNIASTSFSCSTSETPPSMTTPTPTLLESRLRAALWGLFSGDALASPTHWYYGGFPQIQRDYGRSGITTYTKPVKMLPGSILNKSNVNGGGRGSYSKNGGISIIGDVINHGKRDLWDPSKSIHYHATLQQGENTLEAQLVRVLMKSIVATNGIFSPSHFLQSYVKFMTTPDSHNDTYASTCHRMFFANRIFGKREWEDCPDNDYHNVDAIDGLILPSIVSLASLAHSLSTSNEGEIEEEKISAWKEKSRRETASAVAVTRRSSMLNSVCMDWSDVVYDALTIEEGNNEKMLQSLGRVMRNSLNTRRAPRTNGRDEMSACYLSQSLPTAIDMIAKYTITKQNDVWTGLIANANVGGENVHRGSVLGVVLGARAGMDNIPTEKLVDGLYDRESLEKEIDEFVRVVLRKGDMKAEK